MRRGSCKALTLAVALSTGNVAAAADFNIGYLALRDDPRYTEKQVFARYLGQPLGLPYAGAEVALREARFVGAALGLTFKLQRVEGADADALNAALAGLLERDTHFVLIDAPAPLVAAVAAASRGREVVLLNVSAREDVLRQSQCEAHLFHIIPNFAMSSDALAQFLVFRKWREVLVLEGPRAEDTQLTESFVRSARRFGLKITARRPFVLSNDPRERDRNNVTLLTRGVDYDVVFVADTEGEFARDVPYQTGEPRLIVGSEGLAPVAWHWAWERHGAPQLEKRFEQHAKRPMSGSDWAAWLAVKSVVEAVLRAPSREFAAVRDFLRSEQIVIDGFKGNRLNFRPWDNQLRQPMLLATHNWVVERAPLQGFLHAKNNMDTLGFDEPETLCRFR